MLIFDIIVPLSPFWFCCFGYYLGDLLDVYRKYISTRVGKPQLSMNLQAMTAVSKMS